VLVSSRGHWRAPAAPESETPFGIMVAIGAVAMVAAGIVAAMIPTAYPGWRFGVIAFVVFLFAAVALNQLELALVAVIGALIFNGFLEDRLGQLTWHGSDDLWRLLLLVMVGALGLAVGEGCRFIRDLRSRYRKADGIVLPASSLEEEKHGA
jgi:hypothetical protein